MSKSGHGVLWSRRAVPGGVGSVWGWGVGWGGVGGWGEGRGPCLKPVASQAEQIHVPTEEDIEDNT